MANSDLVSSETKHDTITVEQETKSEAALLVEDIRRFSATMSRELRTMRWMLAVVYVLALASFMRLSMIR